MNHENESRLQLFFGLFQTLRRIREVYGLCMIYAIEPLEIHQLYHIYSFLGMYQTYMNFVYGSYRTVHLLFDEGSFASNAYNPNEQYKIHGSSTSVLHEGATRFYARGFLEEYTRSCLERIADEQSQHIQLVGDSDEALGGKTKRPAWWTLHEHACLVRQVTQQDSTNEHKCVHDNKSRLTHLHCSVCCAECMQMWRDVCLHKINSEQKTDIFTSSLESNLTWTPMLMLLHEMDMLICHTEQQLPFFCDVFNDSLFSVALNNYLSKLGMKTEEYESTLNQNPMTLLLEMSPQTQLKSRLKWKSLLDELLRYFSEFAQHVSSAETWKCFYNNQRSNDIAVQRIHDLNCCIYNNLDWISSQLVKLGDAIETLFSEANESLQIQYQDIETSIFDEVVSNMLKLFSSLDQIYNPKVVCQEPTSLLVYYTACFGTELLGEACIDYKKYIDQSLLLQSSLDEIVMSAFTDKLEHTLIDNALNDHTNNNNNYSITNIQKITRNISASCTSSRQMVLELSRILKETYTQRMELFTKFKMQHEQTYLQYLYTNAHGTLNLSAPVVKKRGRGSRGGKVPRGTGRPRGRPRKNPVISTRPTVNIESSSTQTVNAAPTTTTAPTIALDPPNTTTNSCTATSKETVVNTDNATTTRGKRGTKRRGTGRPRGRPPKKLMAISTCLNEAGGQTASKPESTENADVTIQTDATFTTKSLMSALKKVLDDVNETEEDAVALLSPKTPATPDDDQVPKLINPTDSQKKKRKMRSQNFDESRYWKRLRESILADDFGPNSMFQYSKFKGVSGEKAFENKGKTVKKCANTTTTTTSTTSTSFDGLPTKINDKEEK